MLQSIGSWVTWPTPPAPTRRRAMRLDDAHEAIWEAIHHLFPAHAMVNACDHGMLLITWALYDGHKSHLAAPVMVRIDGDLLLTLWTCDAAERKEISKRAQRAVREALVNYDPDSRIPTADVIELLDEAAFA